MFEEHGAFLDGLPIGGFFSLKRLDVITLALAGHIHF